MRGYRSTNSPKVRVGSFHEALFAGQAPDGGLFLPEGVPAIDPAALVSADYQARASATLAAWLAGEIAPEVVADLCTRAFDFPVPVVALDAETFLVELFHGPTAAFKDFGARFMAQSVAALRDPQSPLTVLVATSGDTGAAAAHAFSGLAAARVVLLYPEGGVSPLQELQLTAVPENVLSFRVDGTFDDCQAMVRSAFADPQLVARLGLMAANSINVARLLPQTTYYVHASLELWATPPCATTGMPGKHRPAPQADQRPLVCVPSGNLGNLTAGLLALRQGAPIDRFLAATNRNDAVVRWLASGRLEPRPSVATPSTAMDVGNPSNAARILGLYDKDLRRLRRDVIAASIGDEETLATIRWAHETHRHFVCPHTAVALAALRRHRAESGDRSPALVLATAHPAKFPEIVRAATGHEPPALPALGRLESARRASRRLRADPAALAAFLHRME